jgi:hypothetical protein
VAADVVLHLASFAGELREKHGMKIGTNVPFPWAFRFGTLLVEGMP